MADPFKIVITAVDSATKTIKKINVAFGSIVKPVSKSVKSVQSLGQIGTQSLKSLAKGLNDVSKAGGGTAKVLEWLALPAAVGGIAALATTFGNVGFNLNLTSKLLDMNAADLTRWHYAAKMAGTTAEAFDASYGGAQNQIRSAKFGGDPYGMVLLKKMEVQIATNTDGSIDYLKTFKDIIAAAQKMKSVTGQREFLGHFNMDALIPMVQRGRIDEDRAAAGNKGILSPEQIKTAEKFRNDIDALGESLNGLKLQIGAQLAPVLDPLINAFAAWLDTNRVEIARQLGEAIGNIAAWVKGLDWAGFKKDVVAVWEAIGGLKGVLIGLGLLTFSGPIAGVMKLAGALLGLGSFLILNPIGMVVTLVTALAGLGYLLYSNWDNVKEWWSKLWTGMANDTKTNTDKINDSKRSLFDDIGDRVILEVGKLDRKTGGTAATNTQTPGIVQQLMGLGLSKDAAIGKAANLWTESTYDPKAIGDKGAAYGIGQWHADRQAKFAQLMGKDIHGSSVADQLKFSVLEMGPNGGDAGAARAGYALGRVHSAQAAAMVDSQYYERPFDVEGEKARRGAQAVMIERALGPNFGAVPVTGPDAATTAARQGSTGMPADDGHDARVAALQKLDIALTLHNAPPGTRAAATTADGAVVPTRINHSMGVAMGAMP